MNSKSLYKPPFHVSPKIDRFPTSKIVQPLIYTGAAAGPVARSYIRRKQIDSLNAADQFLQTREAFISLGLTLGVNYKKPEFQNVMYNRGNEETEEKAVVERKLRDAKNAEIIKNTKPPKKSFIMKSKKLLQNPEDQRKDKQYENFQEFTDRLQRSGKDSSSDDEDENYQGFSNTPAITVKGRLGKFDIDMIDSIGKEKAAKLLFASSGITDATIRKKIRDHEKRSQPRKYNAPSQNNVDNFDPMLNIDKILRQGAMLLDESSKIRPRQPGEEDDDLLGHPGPSFDEHYFQDFKPSPNLPEALDPLAFHPPASTATTINTASVKSSKPKSREMKDMKRESKKSSRREDQETNSVFQEIILKPMTPKSKPGTSTARSELNAEPFNGLKISSLVANGAAKKLGYQGKAKDYEDVMNPIQQQMVEEMADFELSSFLPKGHGNRPPNKGFRIYEPTKGKSSKETGQYGGVSRKIEAELDEVPSWVKFKHHAGKYKSRPTQPKISPGLALTTAAMKQAELRAQRMHQRQIYVDNYPTNRKPKNPEKDAYLNKALREAAAEKPSDLFPRIPFTTGKLGRPDDALGPTKKKSNIAHLSTANFDLKTKSEIVRRPGIRY